MSMRESGVDAAASDNKTEGGGCKGRTVKQSREVVLPFFHNRCSSCQIAEYHLRTIMMLTWSCTPVSVGTCQMHL